MENAATCESQEWEATTTNAETITNATSTQSSPTFDTITTVTELHRTSKTLTSTTTSHTPQRSLTTDAKLKHKSKKLEAKQPNTSEDQV